MKTVSSVATDKSKVDDFAIARETKTLNIMLIGCGPHARRVYLPAIKKLCGNYDLNLKVVVELDGQQQAAESAAQMFAPDLIFTKPFRNPYKLPVDLEKKLDAAVQQHDISGVIIATEPLSHMQYALWAMGKGLHILMDKPISTRKNVSNSAVQAGQLAADFSMLMERRDTCKAFIINAQRRYHPGFQYVLEQIKKVAHDYKIPITGMQSTHCDGQWRLPKEVLTQQYHPYIGYGKVSHSGYHLIDVIGRFLHDSFAASGKNFDKVGVYSSFVKPTGLLNQQNRDDYLRVFGEEYAEANEWSDQELAELYKKAGEAEVDSSSLITLFNKGHTTANISLNLMHNGFARRDWLLPGEDLYKGNGRVKHEYHNIEQGPFQNIQIHSYQENDKHEVNTEDDYNLGGNNHFDIYIFRNSGILGGEPLQVVRSKDLAVRMNHDSSQLVIEQVKHRVVHEFIEVMMGERKPLDTQSDLSTHALSASLMSLIYQSGIKRKEVVADYA